MTSARFALLLVLGILGTSCAARYSPARKSPTAERASEHAPSRNPGADDCGPEKRYGGYFPFEDDAEQIGQPAWERKELSKVGIAAQLRDWAEPSLWHCGHPRGPESIRVYTGGYSSPWVIRVDRGSEGVTVRARWVLHEVAEATATSTASDWDGLVDCLARTAFWTARSRPMQLHRYDGNVQLMEASIGRRYNLLIDDEPTASARPRSFECADAVGLLARPVVREVNRIGLGMLCARQQASGLPLKPGDLDPCHPPADL